MNIKRITRVLVIVLMTICFFDICNSDNVSAKKNKKIKLTVGEVYKIKVKMGCKFKSSNKRIAVVNSKGKIKALKKGKCSVVVKNGNKVVSKIKVKVNVKKAKKEKNATNIQNNNTLPGNELQGNGTDNKDINTVINNINDSSNIYYDNYVHFDGLVLDRIEKIDDTKSYVYLCMMSRQFLPCIISETEYNNGIKYLRLEMKNQYLADENMTVGCNVNIGYGLTNNVIREIVGDTCNLVSPIVHVSVSN